MTVVISSYLSWRTTCVFPQSWWVLWESGLLHGLDHTREDSHRLHLFPGRPYHTLRKRSRAGCDCCHGVSTAATLISVHWQPCSGWCLRQLLLHHQLPGFPPLSSQRWPHSLPLQVRWRHYGIHQLSGELTAHCSGPLPLYLPGLQL